MQATYHYPPTASTNEEANIDMATPKNGVSSVGFIISSAENHARICKSATPDERRAMARLSEMQWARNPPANTIRNDPNHGGYGGVDYRNE